MGATSPREIQTTALHHKAIVDFDEAIRLEPQNALFYGGLGWILATCPEQVLRDGKRAIRLATKACELTHWRIGDHLNSLAAAYAETGQFGEAERYQSKALDDPAYQGPAGDEYRQRLNLYKQKKSF
jgi:tetratricopeptide (TPR) repeat protein